MENKLMREPGYYWCWNGMKWLVAELYQGYWYLCGNEQAFKEESMANEALLEIWVVGSKLIEPSYGYRYRISDE